MMLLKRCTQYVSKFGKLSSSHRTGKDLFAFQSQRRTMPKNVQTTKHLLLGRKAMTNLVKVKMLISHPSTNQALVTAQLLRSDSTGHVQGSMYGRHILGTLWTVACLAPLSMEFSRQEYWNG